MEGLTGIEPASLVWKTKALPLSYSPEKSALRPSRMLRFAKHLVKHSGQNDVFCPLDSWRPFLCAQVQAGA